MPAQRAHTGGGDSVRIQLIYFIGCPHWRLAEERLRRAVEYAGIVDAEILLVSVRNSDEAAAAGMSGSPTVLIDGADLFAADSPATGISCRIYRTANGLSGAPGVIRLTAALREASAARLDQNGRASSWAPNPPEPGAPSI
jgi:hypothetical protein